MSGRTAVLPFLIPRVARVAENWCVHSATLMWESENGFGCTINLLKLFDREHA